MFLFNSKIFTTLISVFLVWILFSLISLEFEKDKAKKEIKNTELKIEDVRNDNQAIEKFINNFSNPAFLEKVARLRLNYKKSGEEVVFVYRDLNPDIASTSEKFSLDELPNYKKWWYWLLEF